MWRCCRRLGCWALLGAGIGLYLWGRRLRSATRQPSVQAIDQPVITRSWQKMNNRRLFRIFRQQLAEYLLRGRKDLRVLDVSSGAGELSLTIAQHYNVHEVVGIDLSGELVEQARLRAERHGINARFLQADAAAMPLPDASFDLIVSTLSMHHWEQPQQVLQEIHRVLAPGGRVYIFDLRRDASPLILGLSDLSSRWLVSSALRETGEPVASFQAAFTPCEAVLLAARAGWPHPTVQSGHFWFVLESLPNGE